MQASARGPDTSSTQGWPDLINTALPGPAALKLSESPPRA
ncbi:Uncharacterised protein [Bordetella pertussis]|nr:Uncharacterised protein [Bordetella pertussis]CFW68930.1 Uncharacterised protein [Bordetella pertussis]CPK72206.1 Uncharacterised protein [Bordetella pertussis]CPP69156.1 Uncharacterised protein [Bordetella pertussis]CRE18215.1 Uncharacterised protein [Bordetella pertussis]